VPARACYGPGVLARAAELLCAHYLPVGRATALMTSLLGVPVSVGFMGGVRARAARLLEQTFMPRVRELLRSVGVLHVDETPGRAAGGLEYVHIASTKFLTAMHTGGRTTADIDAGEVLPGYSGTIVRDGYAGYTHLIDAHHAWCAAHYADFWIMPIGRRVPAVCPGQKGGRGLLSRHNPGCVSEASFVRSRSGGRRKRGGFQDVKTSYPELPARRPCPRTASPCSNTHRTSSLGGTVPSTPLLTFWTPPDYADLSTAGTAATSVFGLDIGIIQRSA